MRDLILLLDAIGPLKEDGVAILRALAATLILIPGEYFGAGAMMLGLADSGNVRLNSLPDGTIGVERAMCVQDLASDIALVATEISRAKWQFGLTKCTISGVLHSNEIQVNDPVLTNKSLLQAMSWERRSRLQYEPFYGFVLCAERSAKWRCLARIGYPVTLLSLPVSPVTRP